MKRSQLTQFMATRNGAGYTLAPKRFNVTQECIINIKKEIVKGRKGNAEGKHRILLEVMNLDTTISAKLWRTLGLKCVDIGYISDALRTAVFVPI